MSDCSNQKNQNISAAFPESQGANSGALEVNLDATGLDIFNPNNALSAVQTFNTMNSVANKMFGIDARWFRAVPQGRSADVIFQEYTLSCVEECPLCIKVIVPDGTFPDSKYQFDLMGLEYEIPAGIEIDKKYWEEIAGLGTAPQKKDIVYLPMPNKLYQVESSYLKRGFMEQETTWVVNLIKYQSEASRKESEGLKETIDQYTVSEESLFGEAIKGDIEKITDDKQMSAYNSTSQDKYKTLNKSLKTINYKLDIGGIIVGQSVYNLSTSDGADAITYKDSGEIIKVDTDRAITAWVSSKKMDEPEYTAIPLGRDKFLTYPANFKIKVKGSKKFGINDTFNLYRSEKQSFYGTVIDDSHANEGIYWCKADEAVLNYLDNLQPGWESKTGWKLTVKDPITILDGINGTGTGFIVKVFGERFIKINYGLQEHVAIMDKKLTKGAWYGFVINIGNTWGQYNVNVWTANSSTTGEKLQSIFSETVGFTPEQTEIDVYTINKSDAYITNIRLFNSTIEEEKQIPELLSYFTQNADSALILDNADERLTIPYISQQR